MAISLQDQLLKAGLASKQQANKAKAQKRKDKSKRQRLTRPSPPMLQP